MYYLIEQICPSEYPKTNDWICAKCDSFEEAVKEALFKISRSFPEICVQIFKERDDYFFEEIWPDQYSWCLRKALADQKRYRGENPSTIFEDEDE